MKEPQTPIGLDATDIRLLQELQHNAALPNQELAERAHVSPATALRRVRRLQESGLIAAQVAVLNPEHLARARISGPHGPERAGHSLQAVVEVQLDIQSAERLASFEAKAAQDAAVQQCYRVSPGPDFILIATVADMPGYHQLATRLFTQDANVRNVKAFFVTHRAKFSAALPLGG